jgi:hypothetical protein
LRAFAEGIRDRDLARREFVILGPVLHTASTGEVPFSATFSASEIYLWSDYNQLSELKLISLKLVQTSCGYLHD